MDRLQFIRLFWDKPLEGEQSLDEATAAEVARDDIKYLLAHIDSLERRVRDQNKVELNRLLAEAEFEAGCG